MDDVKVTKTITLDSELLKWVDSQIEQKEFSSLSHAVEKALFELKKTYSKK